MSIMLEESYVLLLHLLHFLLLTSTCIPYVVIIFSHYTFCVTFNMLLYKRGQVYVLASIQRLHCFIKTYKLLIRCLILPCATVTYQKTNTEVLIILSWLNSFWVWASTQRTWLLLIQQKIMFPAGLMQSKRDDSGIFCFLSLCSKFVPVERRGKQ